MRPGWRVPRHPNRKAEVCALETGWWIRASRAVNVRARKAMEETALCVLPFESVHELQRCDSGVAGGGGRGDRDGPRKAAAGPARHPPPRRRPPPPRQVAPGQPPLSLRAQEAESALGRRVI